MARILVIDDDEQVRRVLCRMLIRTGHEVHEAGDGLAGIHVFRAHPADLVITDLIMPGKEGLETIIELRQEFPDLKIIAISGGDPGGADTYLRAAELCGASRIFAKPIEIDDLLAAVDEVLAGER